MVLTTPSYNHYKTVSIEQSWTDERVSHHFCKPVLSMKVVREGVVSRGTSDQSGPEHRLWARRYPKQAYNYSGLFP